MKTETKRKFLIDFLYIVAIIIIIYVFLKYLLSVFMPFILGFLIALLLRPLVEKASKALRLKKKVAATIILILFYSIIGIALTIMVLRLSISLSRIFEDLPLLYQTDILPAINTLTQSISELFSRIDPHVLESLQSIQSTVIDALTTVVSSLSATAVRFLTNMVTAVPSFLLAFLFTIVASFFFTIDFSRISSFLSNQLGGRAKEIILAVKDSFSATIFKFGKAYLILMTMTFIELTVGFLIIGLPNAVGVAFLIALIDILPVLGTGGVMIPWVIIEFINGDITLALSLLIIYAIVTVVRNIVEPKVVGDQIGLYPLLTLMAMYVGTKLFGFVGLLGLPITITVLKNLQDMGVIHIYNRNKPEENQSE